MNDADHSTKPPRRRSPAAVDFQLEPFARSLAQASQIRPVDAGEAAATDMVRSPERHWLDTLQIDEDSALPTSTAFLGDRAQRPSGSDGFVRLLHARRSAMLQGPACGEFARTAMRLLGDAQLSDIDSDGRVWQSRVQPSAGGTHCLEPLLWAQDVTGLESGWYRQDGAHIGRVREFAGELADRLLSALRDSLRHARPAAAIFAVADTRLLAARYPLGVSLMWRDAGAFLATAQLLATAFEVSSTIAGIACPVASVSAMSEFVPHIVGALAVGGSSGLRDVTAVDNHSEQSRDSWHGIRSRGEELGHE